MLRRALVALLVAGAVGLAAVSQTALERRRAGRDEGWSLLYLPSGRYLRASSLGFAPVVADLIYLWSIQYYGSEDSAIRYDLVERIYVDVIGELDPRYRDAYTLASLILSVEVRDPERALRVLDTAMQRNPDDWLYPFEAGFIAFNQLRDYERAAGYYGRAAGLPGAPAFTRRVHAEMFNRAGDKRSSYVRWLEVYEGAEDETIRNLAWSHVHDLKIELDLTQLRELVGEYRDSRGAWPPSLTSLIAIGRITSLPVDPEGLPYLYDPATGKVRAQSKWRMFRR